MMDSYSPRPWHLVLPVLLLGLGAWCFKFESWYIIAVGIMLWLVAWVIIAWIVYADICERRVQYWDSVSRAIDSANHSDLDKLASLGFTQNEIQNRVSVDLNDKRDGLNTTKYFDLPVSSVKLVPVARAVLDGQPFSERRWTGANGLLSTDEFRRLRGVMREHGLIEVVNDKDPRQGYKLTDAGRELFVNISE